MPRVYVRIPLRDRFEAKVDRSGGPDACHPWTAATVEGYGAIRLPGDGKLEYSHRVSWFLEHGKWPELFVCHSCDNPLCCNGKHHFLGTNLDNIRDASKKGRLAHGERNGQAKLTSGQAAVIRASAGRGVDLAVQFGVSPATISEIRHGKKWRQARTKEA